MIVVTPLKSLLPDESPLQGRNSRNQRESQNYTVTHMQQHTCYFLRGLVGGANRWCVSMQWCDITSEFQVHTWRSTGFKNQSARVIQRTMSTKLSTLDGTSGEPHQGGYAGVRLGEARNAGPAEHERDLREEEPSARRARINEAGDVVPRS